MPRARGRGAAHSSISMSPLEMLAGEIEEMTQFVGSMKSMTNELGGPSDSPSLRQQLQETKQNISDAEKAISQRLKMEVLPEEFDRHAELEDQFFELKTDYFSALRVCSDKEREYPMDISQPSETNFTEPTYGSSTAASVPVYDSSVLSAADTYQQPPPSVYQDPYQNQDQNQFDSQPQNFDNQCQNQYQGQCQNQVESQYPSQYQNPVSSEVPPTHQYGQSMTPPQNYGGDSTVQPKSLPPLPIQPGIGNSGYSSNGPNIQRFGNPHSSPALQNMNMGGGGAYNPSSLPPLPPKSPIVPSREPDRDFQVESPSQQRKSDDGVFYDGQQEESFSNIMDKGTFVVGADGDFYFTEQDPETVQQQVMDTGYDDLNIDGFKLSYRDTVFWDTQEVIERNKEMQQIAMEMGQLTEMYQDVALEVEQQGEALEEAEDKIEIAQDNTKQGVKTMGKSAKTAKKVLLPGVGGGAGAVGGAVVGGLIGSAAGGMIIPGAIIGAGVGAAAGGVVGAGFGKVLRLHTDKDMHKARLSEAWQPDSATKNCVGCNKKFTTTKRRHHCRNCGMVFCGKCTKHKMHIPGVSAERRPRVCNKCFEAIMYHAQGVKPPSWTDLKMQTQQTNEPSEAKPLPPLPPIPSRPESSVYSQSTPSLFYGSSANQSSGNLPPLPQRPPY